MNIFPPGGKCDPSLRRPTNGVEDTPMFLGHFAVALASKRAAPKLNLGFTFLACQALDLVWPVLVLSGVEKLALTPGLMTMSPMDFQSYPYSHGLAAVLALSVLAYVLARWAFRRSHGESLVLGALVLSHWFLDVIVH